MSVLIVGETRVVKKSEVASCKRSPIGVYAALFANLLELPGGTMLAVPVAKSSAGYHIKRELAKIAEKELRTLEWERNAQGTVYYFCLAGGRHADAR